MLVQLASKTPKQRAPQAFSVMRVATSHANLLSGKTGEQRIIAQLEGYARLASQLLTDSKFERALEQLRHILGEPRAVCELINFTPKSSC
jgi:hypothetical protein